MKLLKQVLTTLLISIFFLTALCINTSAETNAKKSYCLSDSLYFEADLDFVAEPFFYFPTYDENGNWIAEIEIFAEYCSDTETEYTYYCEDALSYATSYEYITFAGLKGITYEDYSGDEYISKTTILYDKTHLYQISVEGKKLHQDTFDELCDILKNDFCFKNISENESYANKKIRWLSDSVYFYVNSGNNNNLTANSEYYFSEYDADGNRIRRLRIETLPIAHSEDFYNDEKTTNKDILTEISICGIDGFQYDESDDNRFSRITLLKDSEYVYKIKLTSYSNNKNNFDVFCNLVDNNVKFFTYSEINTEETEETNNNSEEISEDNIESEDENNAIDKNTDKIDIDITLIIVAAIAGVVIIAVVAIIVFGSKKKNK